MTYTNPNAALSMAFLESPKTLIRRTPSKIQTIANVGAATSNAKFSNDAFISIRIYRYFVLFFLARTILYFPVDLAIAHAIQSVGGILFLGAPFTEFMVIISWPGYAPQTYVLTALIVVALFTVGVRWEAVAAAIAALGSSAIDTLAKTIVHRPRPTADLVSIFVPLHDYSFPSGHVVFYTAFFGFLFFLAYTLLQKWLIWRNILTVVLGAFVALIGVSRVYLGAHWPSDVIGAYLLGSLCLAAAIYIYRWGKTRYFVHQPVAPESPGPKN